MRKIVSKVFFLICAITVLSLMGLTSEMTLQVEAKIVTVKNAKELNKALGGNHTVKGNKVILRSDASPAQKRISILGNLVLDLNGKTITNREREIEIGSPKEKQKASLKLTGSGKLGVKITANTNGILNAAGNINIDVVMVSGGKAAIKKGNVKLLISDSAFNEVVVSGGKVDYIYQGWPDASTINGKVIIKGGEINKIWSSGDIYVKGGTIGYVDGLSRKVVVSGGRINNGCVGAMDFKMTGGTICSGEEVAVAVQPDMEGLVGAVRISGGKIITMKKNAIGIQAYDVTKLVLTGGQIVNKSDAGKYGICVEAETKASAGTVYWKAEKNKNFKISGFKTGFKKDKYIEGVICRNTKLSAPNKKSKIFNAQKKMRTNTVKGNIKLSYKN